MAARRLLKRCHLRSEPRMAHFDSFPRLRTLPGKDVIRKRVLGVHPTHPSSQTMMQNDQWSCLLGPDRRCFTQFLILPPSVRPGAHIRARTTKDGRELTESRHSRSFPQQTHHPISVPGIAQSGIEDLLLPRDEPSTEKHSATQRR